MKNEVNRALVAEKMQYIVPSVEIMKVGAYMMYGPASLPEDPFTAPERRDPKF